MGQLDKYFRALTEYRKSTKSDRELIKRREYFIKSSQSDRLSVTKYICTVDEDWINEVETGLDYIGKAIAEERQFIRSNGEVVPIEKVKSVSRESVEHLSKHSNLITRMPESADIIPDSLYTVERLTDYAVYENRFLYMLLLFVRDFVSYRYEKIVTLSNTYSGEYGAEKTVETGKRKVVLNVSFKEEVNDDEFLKESNPLKSIISWLDGILKTVNSYLATPLMEFVAKAPLLKPPVTETNVLKMNKNFKGAMRLYHYLTSYQGQGFSSEKTVRPTEINGETADEFAEVTELLSFLTYEHGNAFEDALKLRYDEEEAKRRAEEEKKKTEKLESLKKRIRANGGSAEEYALELEKRLRLMEKDSAALASAKEEIAVLQRKTEDMSGVILELQEKAAEMTAEHSAALTALKARYEEQLSEAAARHEEQINTLKGDLDKLSGEVDSKNGEIEKLRKETEKLSGEKLVSEAKINALKSQCGLFTEADNFSSEDDFNELERQYAAFKAFFKDEWKKAKKKIRSDISKK